MLTVSCQLARKWNLLKIMVCDGFTPTASAVAVKVIFVGAGETRRPTKLNALATDSLAKKRWKYLVLAVLRRLQCQSKNRSGHLSPPQYLVLVSVSPIHGALHAVLEVSRAQAARFSHFSFHIYERFSKSKEPGLSFYPALFVKTCRPVVQKYWSRSFDK